MVFESCPAGIGVISSFWPEQQLALTARENKDSTGAIDALRNGVRPTARAKLLRWTQLEIRRYQGKRLSFRCTSSFLYRRQLMADLALAVLLFLSSSELWHHHQDLESPATCGVCHVLHTPIIQAHVVIHVAIGSGIGQPTPVIAPAHELGPVADQTSPRAPPSA